MDLPLKPLWAIRVWYEPGWGYKIIYVHASSSSDALLVAMAGLDDQDRVVLHPTKSMEIVVTPAEFITAGCRRI